MSVEQRKTFEKKNVHFKEDFELCDVFFYTFPCDECDFETASKKILRYHIRRHNTKNKKLRHKFLSLVFSFSYLCLIYFCMAAVEDYLVQQEAKQLLE